MAAAAPTPAKTPRRGLRPALVVLLLLVLLLGSLATTVWWMARRDAGSAWLLAQLPGVRVTGPKGALIGDFEAERIDVQLPRNGVLTLHAAGWRGLRIEPAEARWKFRILIDRLYAKRVDVKPGTPSTEPLQPPASLALPFQLVVDAVQVQALHAAALGDTPLRDLQARVHLGADAGTLHRVDALSLAFDRLRTSGTLRIGTAMPMPLQARLDLAPDGEFADLQWNASATLAGPLAAPQLQATLRALPTPPPTPPAASAAARPAAAQSLDLAATLRPFAAWPLGDLQARAQAIDLSALRSGAPATSLSGDAQAQTQGLDRPATLVANLVNALPGRWNEGRLPLRNAQLDLRGRPDDTGTFELHAFGAELGTPTQDGGRLQGRGSWTRAGWSLDATLEAIQPAALDARAAAMQLSGPVHVRGSAPAASAPTTLDLQADLAGRLATRGPARAVQLKVDAQRRSDAGTEQIELREALAAAGGARASLSGTATHAANASTWQLAGRAALVDFDPLPWWPGREDSPWRQGPHRLNAKGEFDLAVPVASGASAPARPRGFVEQLAAVRGRAAVDVTNSVLGGVPLSGQASLRNSAATHALAALKFDAGGNRVNAEGRLATRAGASDDQWDVSIEAPALASLAPLWRLVRAGDPQAAIDGSLSASASVSGRWPAVMTSSGRANATTLRIDATSIRSAEASWQLGTRMDAPVQAQVRLGGIGVGQGRLEAAQVALKGTGRAHTLEVRAESTLRPPAWADTLQPGVAAAPATNGAAGLSAAVLSAQGGFFDAAGGAVAGWRGSLQRLELRSTRADAPPWVSTRDVGLSLGWAQGTPFQAEVQPGRAEVLGAALRWSRVAWRAADGAAAAQIEAKAELEPLAVAPLLARAQPNFGWGGDLMLSGRIDIRSAPTFAADIVIERSRGDLTVTDEIGTQALGLTDLRAGLNAADGTWSFTQGLAGSTLGVAAGAVVARTSPSQVWPPADTPIQGVLELRVANLGTWGNWVPAGWRLGGELRTSASIGGRFGAPEYTGEIRGQGLSVRNFLQGVNVSDGDVAIDLQGTSARIERFTARGGDGTLRLEGSASLGAVPQAQLRLAADKFQLLGRVDRRIVTTGQAQVRLDRETLALDGEFGVDEGLIDFTRSDAPGLSDDVVVVRAPRAPATGAAARAEAAPAPARAASEPIVRETPLALPRAALDLRVKLGEQLRVRGRGLDTGLRGELHITSPGGRLAVNGTVRTAEGTYVAYGQKLVIDRGELVFNGPAENPRLNIEATRPNLDVRAGVAVTGTAVNPRVRLFSEPELSEIDKLSWLVLGRASDGLGRTDTALLQRAAMALLAGEGPGATDQLTTAIGLDELSLRQTDGEVRETIVSLGKQLSRRWYVGYERSLNATAGTWQLIYRIAQRFTLRAQSGEDNSLDAIWTWRWQ